MAVATIREDVEAANLLWEGWRDFYHLAAWEERIVTKNFDNGNKRVKGSMGKVGDILHIGKISTKAATRVAASDQLNAANLTFLTDTETEVQAAMKGSYGAISIDRTTMNRVVSNEALKQGYLQEMMAGVAEDYDGDGALLAASLSTSVLGGIGQDITGALLRQALGAIVLQAKNKGRAGKPKFFIYHSRQHEHVIGISEVTAADVRGDSMNPNVNGFVWRAYDLSLNHSGNVYETGGITYNLLHTPESHVIAFNEDIQELPPEPDGLAMNMYVYAEWATAEVEDAEAAVVQTGT